MMFLTEWTDMPVVGFLPEILRPDDERCAADQLNDRYAHGGGFRAYSDAWQLSNPGDVGKATLIFPGDPPFRELSRSRLPLSGETLIFFDSAFLAIVQGDGSFEVSRVD